MLLAAAALCAFEAQAADPLSTETKQAYTAIKDNLVKAAEKMSDEDYNFKASPDIRTFGALIGHVADAQIGTCSIINGAPRRGGAASKTTKVALVAALKDSFAECDKAYDSLTDANASEMLKFRNGERSRLGILVGNVIHDNEEYGYLAVYMRVKSVVPPSSDKK
jgi:Asp-tRNA(Asn)/Glu-tRNA(Gln) amidotransferase B subunit